MSFQYSDSDATRRKRRRQKPVASPSELLDRLTRDLTHDTWIKTCEHLLRDAIDALSFQSPDVLCLGLGSPASSVNPRAQLAFLLYVCGTFKIDRTKVSLYDPVFTEEDKKLIRDLKFNILPSEEAENSNAHYTLKGPTILFMPHCDMSLYESVLRANWTPDRPAAQLPNILLIANRLADYIENNPAHKLETNAPCLLRIAPLLDCRPLPTSNAWPTAFNNTSIQFIRPPPPLPPSTRVAPELVPLPEDSDSEDWTDD